MMFYLPLNCSIAVSAWGTFIYSVLQNIFTKTALFDVIWIIQLFTLGKFNTILKLLNTKFIEVIKVLKICLELIWFPCVVQSSLKVTICFLTNLNGKSIKI